MKRKGAVLEDDESQETIISKSVIEEPSTGAVTSEICSVEDRCRVCTFKELQVIPECQSTGLRLIKRCQVKEQDIIVEDKYINEGCNMYNGTNNEYHTNFEKLSNLGEPGTESLSVASFMLIMFIFAFIMTFVLNKRKERILNEIYSKISIVDR